jgi:hypothetical protein
MGVDPEGQKQRALLLTRVRNRAYVILSKRYPEEFAQIKNELLTRSGHRPIDTSYITRASGLSMDVPLTEPVPPAKLEVE